MPAKPRSLKVVTRPPDEKLTINLGCVDLGQIDLLVQEGFYANRTDLIRTAVRNQLQTHRDVVRQVVSRKTLVLGIHQYGVAELQAVVEAQEQLDIRVLGLVVIAPDVSAELAKSAIGSLTVLGALQASSAIKAALADRMR
ncbi:MAG: CopG family transcriptional regulator [Burkholderiales bacterium]